MTGVDKTSALAVGALSAREDFENRLFYQARNLAIEAFLLRIDNRLLRKGFAAESSWSESSGTAPTVDIRLPNPKRVEGSWEYGTCTLRLKRESVDGPEHLSRCYYTFSSFERDEYWQGKQPQHVAGFRDAVEAMKDEFPREVSKLNYPFDYLTLSIF